MSDTVSKSRVVRGAVLLAQALLLQQAHIETKSMAPARCELAKLEAEIAILQQLAQAVRQG